MSQPVTCSDCLALQDLIDRRARADEEALLEEDFDLGVTFTRTGWRLDGVSIQRHPGLSVVAATSRGPEKGRWLLRCQACQAFWQVHHNAYYLVTTVSPIQIPSPEAWIREHRKLAFFGGDELPPKIAQALIATAGLASGLFAYWLRH